ncbi:putative endonuclease [Fadolivirus algeromassiliense]|jgi:hypothetical protein|uniref:Endonuclease n=1 Tax=Fadolivirus FV1/VV64 TaxID=3070911 RepID=A0A7D3R0Q9_9VIRU|nr:putative endonuclease [Fadolivirus algeromassiliense]QKF93922.1 putative endonuclease [Fadolivirus FV1/VV64]
MNHINLTINKELLIRQKLNYEYLKMINNHNKFYKKISLVDYKIVNYNNKLYIVCKKNYKNNYKLFVVDDEFKEKIIYKNWFYIANGYIAHQKDDKKFVYLHKLIMDVSENKNVNKSIDHINRIPTDNRKENLRSINQTEQNINQGKKIRKSALPQSCNINVDDLPRGVWYRKKHKKYAEHFVFEIKGVLNIYWESCKDKTLSLKFKLEQTKKYIRYLIEKYPELKKYAIENNYTDEAINLIKSYNEILKLSGYECAKNNFIKINEKNYLIENLDGLTEKEIGLLNEFDPLNDEKIRNEFKQENKKFKNMTTKLPENCGVTKEMIPKYCYYRKPYTNKKNIIQGDCFVIDKRHPKMNNKSWNTTSNKSVTTIEKFNQLLEKLKEIEH